MSGESVLIIEDDPTLLRVLADNFRHEGYTVRTACDGKQGLDAAINGRPDLIVLDLMLPGVDGLEVYHVDHNPSVREKYLRIAEALDLVPTAGSDFHGEAISPQRRLGDVTMPEEELARLESRRP